MSSEPTHRARVRLISALDRAGSRYLTADVLLCAAAGCWPMPISTGLVDANSRPLAPPSDTSLARQLRAVAQQDEQGVALKTGLLPSATCVSQLAELLETVAARPYVLDPELFDRGGRPRVSGEAVDAMRERLLPKSSIVVANACEAEALTGRRAGSRGAMKEACRALFDRGPAVVIVTGGHLDHHPVDIFYDGNGFEELGDDRIPINGTLVGAGGVLSAIICGCVSRGMDPLAAAHHGRRTATAAIRDRVLVASGTVMERDPEARIAPASGYWVADHTCLVGQGP